MFNLETKYTPKTKFLPFEGGFELPQSSSPVASTFCKLPCMAKLNAKCIFRQFLYFAGRTNHSQHLMPAHYTHTHYTHYSYRALIRSWIGFQNDAFLLIRSFPRSMSRDTLRYLLGTPSIGYQHVRLPAKAICGIPADPGHPLHSAAERMRSRVSFVAVPAHFCLPRAATEFTECVPNTECLPCSPVSRYS